jgi:hypothetical protein
VRRGNPGTLRGANVCRVSQSFRDEIRDGSTCSSATPGSVLTTRTSPFSAPRLKEAGCRRIFEEKVCGATRDRPQLTRLLDHIREQDVLVVARLDRLARSTRDLLEIAELLRDAGAGLRSLGEPWADTTSAAGRKVLTVFAGMAEFERALILSISEPAAAGTRP